MNARQLTRPGQVNKRTTCGSFLVFITIIRSPKQPICSNPNSSDSVNWLILRTENLKFSFQFKIQFDRKSEGHGNFGKTAACSP